MKFQTMGIRCNEEIFERELSVNHPNSTTNLVQLAVRGVCLFEASIHQRLGAAGFHIGNWTGAQNGTSKEAILMQDIKIYI